MAFEQLTNWWYFGGMVVSDPTEIWDSLVEDDNEQIRQALPADVLTEFDNEDGERAYDYIMAHIEPVYIRTDNDTEGLSEND